MTEYVKVRFTASCPEFMGTDLEAYGPFSEGDTAELPWENAEILINRGMAEKIEDKKPEAGEVLWPKSST